MSEWRYCVAGVRLRSFMALPEWDVFHDDSRVEPDVTVHVKVAEHPILSTAPSVATRDNVQLVAPGIARYQVREGRQIEVTRDPSAGDREVRLFLLGSAFAALCCQRNMLLLHASVIRHESQTVAFCGPAGSGKSTLAAAFVKRGAEFISDDLCRFDIVDNGVFVHPSTPRLKLWREALDNLGWHAPDLERDHIRADKFQVPISHANHRTPVPLHAIISLGWTTGEPSVTEQTGLASLRGLVESATYRPDMLERMGQTEWHWRQCADLASRVGRRRFDRPRDWNAIDRGLAVLWQAMSAC